jgi:hypothetical protein
MGGSATPNDWFGGERTTPVAKEWFGHLNSHNNSHIYIFLKFVVPIWAFHFKMDDLDLVFIRRRGLKRAIVNEKCFMPYNKKVLTVLWKIMGCFKCSQILKNIENIYEKMFFVETDESLLSLEKREKRM